MRAFFAIAELLVVYCVRKIDRSVFDNILCKTQAILMKLVGSFLNKFAAKLFEHFPPRLNNVSTLPCDT